MKKLKISQAIIDGTIVSLRGDKLIRCSRIAKPFGVYQATRRQKIITEQGIKIGTYPSGIVISGFVYMDQGDVSI